MKFHRTTKLFRGQLDPVPLMCVLFPMAFFLLFHTFLVLPGGVRLELPREPGAAALPLDEPALVVAVDSAERIYFQNQIVPDDVLGSRLAEIAGQRGGPKLLVIEPDQSVSWATLQRISALARTAGLREVLIRANRASVAPP
jgi:biopolymer transport protein ExbD